jgi:hypothetical protein
MRVPAGPTGCDDSVSDTCLKRNALMGCRVEGVAVRWPSVHLCSVLRVGSGAGGVLHLCARCRGLQVT